MHTVTQAEIDAGGDLTNQVVASSDQAPDASTSLDIPIEQSPSLSLVKGGTLNAAVSPPETATNPGDLIEYTFDVTNTGNTTLVDIEVTDPMVPVVSCDGASAPPQIPDLAPSETTTCTGSYTIVPPDIDAGQKTNTATASSAGTGPVTDTVTVRLVAKTFSGPTATGSGDATVSFTGDGPDCGFTSSAFLPLEGDPLSPPTGSAPIDLVFPHGLAAFVVNFDCTPGFTAEFTYEAPSVLERATEYWKYGPTPDDPTPHWYEIPSTLMGNRVTFRITDGGRGDDDLTVNGTIVDRGGPALTVPAVEIPTLGTTSLVLLACLLGLAAAVVSRRREVR